METEFTHSSLLIELDALFDTRLGTIGGVSQELFNDVISNNYHNRLGDFFPNISNEEYRRLYSLRDKKTLFRTMINSIGHLLRDFAKSTIKNSINSPFIYKPRILINVHPYDLTTEEEELIIKGVAIVTNGMADIKCINRTYEELTPMYVKNNLSIMILYEYYNWLEIHSANKLFKKTTCPEVTLLGPAIYINPINKTKIPKEDPFRAFELLAEPIINLKLLPIEMFSIAIKDSKQDTE